MKRKGLVKGIAVVIMMILCMPQVFALSQVRVKVNGAQVDFPDAMPYIDTNNRVMVPVRFVSEQLGAKVEWDKVAMRVTVTDGDKEVLLTIGNKEVMVNGEARTLDTAAVLKGTRTYVPLRFVSEALGANVRWDGKVRIAYIDNGNTPIVPEKIYETGPFSIVAEPGWRVDGTDDSWKITTETELGISASDSRKSLGNYMTLILTQGMIVPYSEQCDEAEQILQQAFPESKAKEIVAYARKKTGRTDALAEKKFYEGDYVIIVKAEGDTVNIKVNKK